MQRNSLRRRAFIMLGCLLSILAQLPNPAGASESVAQRPHDSTAATVAGSSEATVSQDAKGRQIVIQWPAPKGVNKFEVAIDDSPSLREPVLRRSVTGASLTLNVLESGLAPGVNYSVLVKPGNVKSKFRIHQAPSGASLPSAGYLLSAWETAGRSWLSDYSGARWNSSNNKWSLDEKWSYADGYIAPQAYYIEFVATAAVNQALTTDDLPLIDELAQFYQVYLGRFTTLGEMRKKKSAQISTDLLDDQGPDSTRTLPWLENMGSANAPKIRAREYLLANCQFFHPVARLIRVITLLAESKRTPAMRAFVASYTPLIIEDHLLRAVYKASWDYWGARDLPKELINIWRTIISGSGSPQFSYQRGMFDWDLWLIATAAEILGAHANAPDLVPVSVKDTDRLKEIVTVGTTLFQKKRTVSRDAQNFQKQRVETASYFNGDFDDHPVMEYAGYTGKTFPRPDQKRSQRGGSWDISHFCRVPIFLRSLYDNRKATGNAFPQARDVELVVNQFVYKVFEGDFNKPRFRNFFDGGDGWYKVTQSQKPEEQFGYPPSPDCDSSNSLRPCLSQGALYGWGLIAFFIDDSMRLQQSLVKLALAKDRDSVAFRDRYYKYINQSFAFYDGEARLQYPFLLYIVLAELPDQSL